MNLKNKKIFSRIAAGVMTVAMAITLLPGTMKTVNAAEPVTSASLDVNLYKRADVYAPNTTFEFEVTNLTAEQAKATNGGKDLKPPFKNAPAGAVKPGTIELAPAAEDLTETSISIKLTFTLVADKFTTEGIGSYRYKVRCYCCYRWNQFLYCKCIFSLVPRRWATCKEWSFCKYIWC